MATRMTDYNELDLDVQQERGGGFGIVLMGPDRKSEGKWRALKTLRPELLAGSPQAGELFVREALIWVGLWPHANLLTAHFVCTIRGQPYISLDYAEQGSLRAHLRASHSFAMRLRWAQHIAAGLVALHSPDPDFLRPEPIVHRDLKPENILVRSSAMAQITDFGLAKAVEQATQEDPVALALVVTASSAEAGASHATGHSTTAELDAAEDQPPADPSQSRAVRTARGAALGSVAYMAPEQWRDAASAGTPADCYALGLILSELLAGRHALLDLDAGHSTDAWRQAHATGSPRPLKEHVPELPDALETLYQALVAKRPENRPTAAEAFAALQAAAAALGREPYDVPELHARTNKEVERIRWTNWGYAHQQFGLYSEAMVRYDRALALDPHHVSSLLGRADVLARMGRPEAALSTIDGVMAQLPANATEERQRVWARRANVLLNLGRRAEAEKAYEQSLALAPDTAPGWAERAINQQRWGHDDARAGHRRHARAHFERGVQYAQRALALDPELTRATHILDELQADLAQLR